jgi:nucleotide-binding universal stress UspA family protein
VATANAARKIDASHMHRCRLENGKAGSKRRGFVQCPRASLNDKMTSLSIESIIGGRHPEDPLGDECRRTMTYFSSTLAAVDGSLASDDALDVACTIAKDRGGKLTACGVVEPQVRLLGRHVQEAPDSDAQREIFAALRIAAELARAQYGLTIDTTLAHAVEAILAEAQRTAADTIVMGTHGRTGLDRVLVGSVAEGGPKAQHGPGAIGPSLAGPASLSSKVTG